MISLTSAIVACIVCMLFGVFLGIFWAVETSPGYDARTDKDEPTWKVG